MMASTVWTTLSGGRPPSLRERSMLPREANIRIPSSSAAANWAPIRSPASGGEDVVVVKAGGAAVLQQLPHASEGAEAHHVLVQPLPDLIQGGEPVEQLQVLHLGQVPGEHLIEMVVGVDEAGIAPAMGPVDHRRRRSGAGPGPWPG